MTKHATDRLVVAIMVSVAGALLAVLIGMAEIALFVVPWVVLCALGLTRDQRVQVRAAVTTTTDRLLVGDIVDVSVAIEASERVRVEVTPQPGSAFGSRDHAVDPGPGIVDIASARRPTDIAVQIEAHDWGTLNVGPMGIQATGPYGLFILRGAVAQPTLVRVHPTPQDLREMLAPWMVRRVSGTHRSRESAQGIEYADLREFAAGDAVRDINWRASARSDELWVSQRHPDSATDVILLVDSFVETGHDITRVFGMVVEAAIALAESHLSATDRVGLVEFGGLVRWVTPGTGPVQLQRLTDGLLATGLYANAADKELPILPPRVLPARSFVVAFTPLLDQRFVDAVFTARQRGHDVAVLECAPPLGGDGSDLGASVARDFWTAERVMLRDRMAEQGIAVAQWDGTDPIDIALGELIRRRRRAVRIGNR